MGEFDATVSSLRLYSRTLINEWNPNQLKAARQQDSNTSPPGLPLGISVVCHSGSKDEEMKLESRRFLLKSYFGNFCSRHISLYN